MAAKNVQPQDLGFSSSEWEQFGRDIDANPERALADLESKRELHGTESAARPEPDRPVRSAEDVEPDLGGEGTGELTAEDIRDYSEGLDPLPTSAEVAMLQEVVDDVHARLLTDPEFAASFLSDAELRQVHENPHSWTDALFGKAMERAVAVRLETEPALSRFLHTPQRIGVPTPDIGGPIRPTGPQAFDVTVGSESSIARHEKRPYAGITELVTFPPLPDGWRFPHLGEIGVPATKPARGRR
jgi:hypothetical protein